MNARETWNCEPSHFCGKFKYCLATVTMETGFKQPTDKQFIILSPWQPFHKIQEYMLPFNHYYGNCFANNLLITVHKTITMATISQNSKIHVI